MKNGEDKKDSDSEFEDNIHYEKKFTKNIQCPKILNKFTKFQFEEYLTNCQKIDFCSFLLKISKHLPNSLKIQ